MAPCEFEAFAHAVVGHVLLALLGHLVAEEEVAVEAVAFHVVALERQAPGTLGIDFAQHGGIHLVADGKVVAAVAQVEAAGRLVAVGGHDYAAAVAAGEGEESVGDGQRQGHVLHIQVGRPEDHVLAGAHLGAGEGQIEMGMLGVAGGILGFFHVEYARGVTLAVDALHEALSLFGVHIRDEGLSGFEVVGNLVGLVLVLSLLEHGLSLHGSCGVGGAHGMHQAAVDTHVYAVGRELQVLVVHLAVAEEGGPHVGIVKGDGVLCRIGDGHVQSRAAALYGVGCHGVLDRGIGQNGVGPQGHRIGLEGICLRHAVDGYAVHGHTVHGCYAVSILLWSACGLCGHGPQCCQGTQYHQ